MLKKVIGFFNTAMGEKANGGFYTYYEEKKAANLNLQPL